MKPEIEKRTNLLVGEIQKSTTMTAEEKMDIESILLSASEGTNGLTPEDKLQNVSETVYSIVTLLISKMLDKQPTSKLDGMLKAIVECKWQLTIIAGLLCLLLIFQPQIAAILAGLCA